MKCMVLVTLEWYSVGVKCVDRKVHFPLQFSQSGFVCKFGEKMHFNVRNFTISHLIKKHKRNGFVAFDFFMYTNPVCSVQ